MMSRLRLFCTTFILVACSNAYAANKGFLDFNLYPYLSDVDNDSVFTINAAAKFSPRWSYFSLTNFSNNESYEALEETAGYYTEQNLRYHLWGHSAFDATLQWNLRSGTEDDRLRLGVRWRLQDSAFWQDWFKWAHLSYTLNVHFLQLDHSDDSVWQMEHAFFWRAPGKLVDRVYVSGFIDHTFGETLADEMPSNPIVAEVQLGYRFYQQFYFVYEYRINEYRRSNVNNAALGLEYKFLF